MKTPNIVDRIAEELGFTRDEVTSSHPKGKCLLPDGSEYPDPVPVKPPLGFISTPSVEEMVRRAIRSENVRMAAYAAGYETFEESDDFDVGDDFDPTSPYEEVFDPGEAVTPPVESGEPAAAGEPKSDPAASTDDA